MIDIKTILFSFIFLLVIFVITRYILYHYYVSYKPIEKYNKPINNDFDNMWRDCMDREKHYIESDYDKIDLDFVDDSFNVCYIREYPWSNPHDSTIKLADIRDGQNILDAGCGVGNTSIYLCKKFPNVTCHLLVNSKKLYQKTLENIKKDNLENRITLYLMDFDKLEKPISQLRFDRILFLESMDYSKNRELLLKNMYNLLDTDGKIFIKTPGFKDQISKGNYEICRNIVDIWRYNFSCLGSVLNDARKIEGADISYVDIDPFLGFFFLNPVDILNLFMFIIRNRTEQYNNWMGIIKNLFSYNIIQISK